MLITCFETCKRALVYRSIYLSVGLEVKNPVQYECLLFAYGKKSSVFEGHEVTF